MTEPNGGPRAAPRAPWILETSGVLFLLLNMFLSAALAPPPTQGVSELVGRMFAPLFLGLMCVAATHADES